MTMIDRLERVWVGAAAITITVLGVTADLLAPFVIGWLVADVSGATAGLLVGVPLALLMWPGAYFLVRSVRRMWPPTA
jgi:hypothetical protein